jgi:hypothetical protein
VYDPKTFKDERIQELEAEIEEHLECRAEMASVLSRIADWLDDNAEYHTTAEGKTVPANDEAWWLEQVEDALR